MTARMLGAALLLCVAGCMSVPIATIARFSRFDEGDFAAIDADAVRVRISLPEGFALDASGCRLRVSLSSEGRAYRQDFNVELETTQRRIVSTGWLSTPEQANAYVLRLSGDSRRRFGELQRSMRNAKAQDVRIDVSAALAAAPKGATATTVWIDILLAQSEGYVTLIEAGTIPLNRTEVYKP